MYRVLSTTQVAKLQSQMGVGAGAGLTEDLSE